MRNFWHQRIVRIRVAQQRTNRQQNLRNRQRRRPLLFQNVQTNAPVRVHVRMVHFCFEIYLWRFKRVIGREVDRDEEQAALVRTFGWADDGRVPVEYVVLRPRASRARGWRIFLQVLYVVTQQIDERTRVVRERPSSSSSSREIRDRARATRRDPSATTPTPEKKRTTFSPRENTNNTTHHKLFRDSFRCHFLRVVFYFCYYSKCFRLRTD